MPFGIPVVWREPKNHHDDCYFCIGKPLGRNAKSMKHIECLNISSTMLPVPHSDEVPVPICPQNVHPDSSSKSSNSDGEAADVYEEFHPMGTPEKNSQFSEQNELDDLVRDLGLPKESVQLLDSRLAEKKKLLASNTRLAWDRH